MDDVAYALFHAVPFWDDAAAMRDFAVTRPPDRRRRIAVFAAAYGLPDTRGLVDQVVRQHRLMVAQLRAGAARGFEPVASRVATEPRFLARIDDQTAWIERHRDRFE